MVKQPTKQERDSLNVKLFTKLSNTELSKWEREDIENELYELNMGLAKHIVKKFLNNSPERYSDDLISAANVGLFEGIRGFDIGRGFKFATYADFTIRNKVNREIKYLLKRDGYGIAEVFSLNNTTDYKGEEKEYNVLNSFKADDFNLSETVEKKVLFDNLVNIARKILTERELIVFNNFIKNSDTRKTGEEIGKIIGVTQVQASRIQKVCLEKIKKYYENDILAFESVV